MNKYLRPGIFVSIMILGMIIVTIGVLVIKANFGTDWGLILLLGLTVGVATATAITIFLRRCRLDE